MAVTVDDVRHIALLARLGVDDARANALVAQLNTILEHMDVLSKVDVGQADEVAGVGAAGMPLREDGGASVPLTRSLDGFAPAMRDGFLLVPRLSTHEDPEEA